MLCYRVDRIVERYKFDKLPSLVTVGRDGLGYGRTDEARGGRRLNFGESHAARPRSNPNAG
jgi:hypothetical protein